MKRFIANGVTTMDSYLGSWNDAMDEIDMSVFEPTWKLGDVTIE